MKTGFYVGAPEEVFYELFCRGFEENLEFEIHREIKLNSIKNSFPSFL